MNKNTLCEVIDCLDNEKVTDTRTETFFDSITKLYDDLFCEELTDTNIIATTICETILETMPYSEKLHEVTVCTLIYDIFDTCKIHARNLN